MLKTPFCVAALTKGNIIKKERNNMNNKPFLFIQSTFYDRLDLTFLNVSILKIKIDTFIYELIQQLYIKQKGDIHE
jgi:hypothetical protein